MPDVRPVLYLVGFLLVVLAAAMAVPALLDYALDDLDWQVFAGSALVTGFCGLGLVLANRPRGRFTLTPRQAFLFTGAAWISVSVFGALPFVFSELDMSLADAVFESTSGITASGSTVITGLDAQPHGILLWRALLHWLGGIGIIVMAVALLPLLRIGGMQLFRMEFSDKTEKVRPRVSQIAGAVFAVYTVATILCCAAYWAAGMSFFDAACHAMSTLATGGFANSDSSLGGYTSPLIEWLAVLFMIVGGTTFILFISPWRHNQWSLLHNSQVGWYLAFLAFFSTLLSLWHWATNDAPFADALRHSTFSVVSIVTTTGFAVTDYTLWGGFAEVTFFILSFIGGCTGSTSGGIKIFRFQVLFAMGGVHLKRLLHPHGVFIIDFHRQNVSEAVVRSVLGFMVLYFFSFAMLALSLTIVGLDEVTALSGAVAALGNVGPGLGPIIGPAGSFQPLPDAAKWLLSFGMLLGRLEILTLIVLLLPDFWKS